VQTSNLSTGARGQGEQEDPGTKFVSQSIQSGSAKVIEMLSQKKKKKKKEKKKKRNGKERKRERKKEKEMLPAFHYLASFLPLV
jgi:hypothetical protein